MIIGAWAVVRAELARAVPARGRIATRASAARGRMRPESKRCGMATTPFSGHCATRAANGERLARGMMPCPRLVSRPLALTIPQGAPAGQAAPKSGRAGHYPLARGAGGHESIEDITVDEKFSKHETGRA